jgi:hypothetical protein
MEYLPQDPSDKELKTIEKSDKKMKEFREFIVDKGIVLAFVKVLLSLKYSENKPKNPIKAIREFFGKYKDPRWDEMDVLKEEIVLLNQENPKLFEKVQSLEEELETLKKTKRTKNLFKAYELDKNVSFYVFS